MIAQRETYEDIELMTIMKKLRQDMELIESNLNNVTDPLLIDSFVYELKAVHVRYQYYLQICKSNGSYQGGEKLCQTSALREF